MLSEISQRKISILLTHLYVESKTPNECVKQEKDSQIEHTSSFQSVHAGSGDGQMQAKNLGTNHHV